MIVRFCMAKTVRLTVIFKIVLMVIFTGGHLNAAQEKPSSGITHNDLFSASFPTEETGWACGRWGTILCTGDKGQTWTPQKSDTDNALSGIFFVDARKGWAIGDAGTILHTEDGGLTWVKQKSLVPYALMGIYFANSLSGWIVGERTTILHTGDGGENWQIQFQNEDYILKKVSFCDPNNGWAVGEYGYIYRTHNGGEDWLHQAGEFRYLEHTGELIAGNYLFDVIAVNPQTAWVIGIDGYVAKTIDGGKAWLKVTSGVPKTHLFAVCSDKKGGILIGGVATLRRNIDGGNSFVEATMTPKITYGWIYEIVSRGNEGFAAVGKDGWIYLSDASGNSWSRVFY